MTDNLAPRRRCRALVYHRDTYRRTGRGKWGFEMHYTQKQCKRAAADDSPYCGQHGKMKADWPNYISDCSWASEYLD